MGTSETIRCASKLVGAVNVTLSLWEQIDSAFDAHRKQADADGHDSTNDLGQP